MPREVERSETKWGYVLFYSPLIFLGNFSTVSSMYYTYILGLSDGEYYIGFSTDLKQRFKEHFLGNVEATKNRRPVRLVYYAAFMNQKKATDFEKYLKSSSGFAFRNKRLV